MTTAKAWPKPVLAKAGRVLYFQVSSMQDYDIETLAVRAGTARSQFNEHSEALHLTSSFVFANAAEAADRFCNNAPGHLYSRFTKPTAPAFQERLAALERAQASVPA